MDIWQIVLGLDVMSQAALGNLGRRSWTASCLDGGRRHLLRPGVLEAHAGPAGGRGKGVGVKVAGGCFSDSTVWQKALGERQKEGGGGLRGRLDRRMTNKRKR